MEGARRRVAWVLLVAYVVATAAHVGYVVAHEPFAFDAWNVAVDTDAQPITVERFFAYWRHEYAHANPRLGQPLAYLAYKVDGFAEVATPLAFLGATLAIVVLGLGRWPRRLRDVARWGVVLGCSWFALPELGRTMFSRGYAANYVYAAAIQLWFLAVLRLELARGAPSVERCLSIAMFGALAGMCNEHTGPALIALTGVGAWCLRRVGRPARIVVVAAAGVAVGFAAILFAPGQDERYDGLARRMGLAERVLDRGLAGALDLAGDYLAYAAPVLGLLVLVALSALASADGAEPTRRAAYGRALRASALALLAGGIVVATLCASPKLGSRFFIAPIALLLAGLVALLDAWAPSLRRLAPLLVLAAASSLYAAIQTVPLYRELSAQSDARLAALASTPRGAAFVVEPWVQVAPSWWCLGDDFRDRKKRTLVASYLGLTRVTFAARPPRR
ncbi:MAG: DUF6056 family protein [Kofleriaceae bacterium]